MSDSISILKHIHTGSTATSLLGAEGESLAKSFLERQSFLIVMANFKAPVGRNRRDQIVTGEIDLIAYEKNVLCFIEVKTRRSDEFSSPLSAIDLRKQRQIVRTARVYRKIFHLENHAFRYDAVSVLIPSDFKKPQIALIRNFFDEAKFKKFRAPDGFGY